MTRLGWDVTVVTRRLEPLDLTVAIEATVETFVFPVVEAEDEVDIFWSRNSSLDSAICLSSIVGARGS